MSRKDSWQRVGVGLAACLAAVGCGPDWDAVAAREEARRPYDQRIEVLLPPGASPYAQTNEKTAYYRWHPIPTYFRDQVTGLCFAATEGEQFSGLAQVPCGVVEGARARLVAKGWKPGEAPTP